MRDAMRQHSTRGQHETADPLRVRRQYPHHAEQRQAGDRGESRGQHDGSTVRAGNVRGVGEDIYRQQSKNRDQVEHPLHDDRGEGRRRRKPFASGQHVRAEEIASPRRQQAQGRESDHGGAERRPVPNPPQRGQEHLPAICPHDVRQSDEDQTDGQKRHISRSDMLPYGGQVGVTEKPAEQGNRQNRHERGTGVRVHDRLVTGGTYNISGC